MLTTLFTKQGALRTDFTDAETTEIGALDPARRKAFDKLVASAKHNETAEAALKTEEDNLKQAMVDQNTAARDIERTALKLTHHDLFRHHVKKIPLPSPTLEQIAAEATAMQAAENLALARDALDSARVAVKDSRATFATSLGVWMNDGKPIPTREQLVRDAAKNYKPTPRPQRNAPSLIDAIAESSAAPIDARQRGQHFRRGAGGQRSYPQGMRGQRLPGFVKG
jgi:hypothetical protein